ncbi:bifunctional alpha/beta hydrolase/class I SAM-dependent methyltransferase [Pseudomonas sp. MOIL14HWK12:I2]|uniref:bifunctional alpha/beta hydrolase/class I SAM-dependent methyltransferase n=1 Tax=Pseudomonas sp. MOIL14HWK12:I2 TaxID=1033994 RepID=UPI0003F82DB8|nr:bifunctional alpha/beta hydrolase/class I SAM-dependent methyltransferase [Pseudomonas sp. MOIL14HWK12:I2]
MDDDCKRQDQSAHFPAHDGTELFYRHWPAVLPSAQKQAIVLLHRGHEHSLRLAHLVDELGLPDYDFFAWDARGHGNSPGPRGDSPCFGTSVADLQAFIEHLTTHHGVDEANAAIVAQSVGAVVAATWAHDYAPRIRCLVLAAPAFQIKLYVPFAWVGLRLLYALRGNFFINSYVKPRFLTHDSARIAEYQRDPAISRAISVRMLLGLREAADRVVKDAGAIRLPTQLLISGRDAVVKRSAQERFFANLGTPYKEKHELTGFFHDTLGERQRERVLPRIKRFILSHGERRLPMLDLRSADRHGPTCAEAEGLADTLPRHSLRAWYWRAVRLGLQQGARLSEGLRLGRETGFDSGSTLDYIYRYQPNGRSALGRWIDHQYLNAIGWRGIRQRKLNLEALLLQAQARLRQAGMASRILDIAAGHGRYVLDALAQFPQPPEAVRLRDYSERNVHAGRALIRQRGLDALVTFEQGDAFDAEALAALRPRPTLIVVSGLYELFADNALIDRSLLGLTAALEPGGYLIYTGQPWHPQLEFIARALTSHREGAPWVMRRREQTEMDLLVAHHGLRKLTQRTDDWGIFTVSLARKPLC